MKLRRNFKILLFLLCGLLSFAQESQPNTRNLYLEIGVSHESLKDKVFADLKFDGPIFQAGLGFEKTTNKSFWSVDLSGNFGTIKYGNIFPTLYLDLGLGFKYAKSINSTDQNSLFAGGAIYSNLNILDYNGYENGSWMTGHNIGILLKKNVLLKNHAVETELIFPLISLISRPPYAGRDEFVFSNTDNIPKIILTRNKLYSVNKFFNPKVSFKYSYDLGKLDLFSRVQYEFLLLNTENKYLRNSLEINFGLALDFNRKNS